MLAFRGVFQRWRAVMQQHPTLRRSLSALFWLPTAVVFSEFLFTIKSVRGRSMQPTLNPDSSPWRDIVVFDRVSVRTLRRYARGDVVALYSPVDSKLIVKRILALEGDIVKTLPPYPDAEVQVPEGYAWVEGDESFHTEDSNRFGPVPLALIDSKLSYIVWPLDRMGPLRKPTLPDPKGPRGPAWRRDMAAVERDRWRDARVVKNSAIENEVTYPKRQAALATGTA